MGGVGLGGHGWGAYVHAFMRVCVGEWSERVSRMHLDEVVIDPCPIGQEEAAARRQAVKEEELLLGT